MVLYAKVPKVTQWPANPPSSQSGKVGAIAPMPPYSAALVILLCSSKVFKLEIRYFLNTILVVTCYLVTLQFYYAWHPKHFMLPPSYMVCVKPL